MSAPRQQNGSKGKGKKSKINLTTTVIAAAISPMDSLQSRSDGSLPPAAEQRKQSKPSKRRAAQQRAKECAADRISEDTVSERSTLVAPDVSEDRVAASIVALEKQKKEFEKQKKEFAHDRAEWQKEVARDRAEIKFLKKKSSENSPKSHRSPPSTPIIDPVISISAMGVSRERFTELTNSTQRDKQELMAAMKKNREKSDFGSATLKHMLEAMSVQKDDQCKSTYTESADEDDDRDDYLDNTVSEPQPEYAHSSFDDFGDTAYALVSHTYDITASLRHNDEIKHQDVISIVVDVEHRESGAATPGQPTSESGTRPHAPYLTTYSDSGSSDGYRTDPPEEPEQVAGAQVADYYSYHEYDDYGDSDYYDSNYS
jgi:hypothetical protein